MITRLTNIIHRLIKTLLIAAAMFAGTNANAQTPESVDSLKDLLAKATNPADSVEILHNLYDCFYFNDRKPVLIQIFDTAERAGDYRAMLEVLFVLTSLVRYEPEMEEALLAMVDRVPESEEQKTTKLYIKLRFRLTGLSSLPEAERQKNLHQTLKEYRDEVNIDKFDRISHLFYICAHLRNNSDSKILTQYLDELQGLVEDLPEEDLAVRTIYYQTAIAAYLNNGLLEKAVEANKHMLEIVGKFDKFHASQGRKFRNYDGTLFQAYYNMLACADVLTDEEVDMYYNRLLNIVATNPRIGKSAELKRKSRIFYLMAKKRYAEAIPLLKEQLEGNRRIAGYHLFADAMVKAARETGDKESLLYGSKIVNTLYKERLKAKSDVSLNELQTIYDVENLKGQNKHLTIESQHIEISERQQFVIASVIAVVVVISILIWMISLYIHSRWLAKRLFSSNRKLVEERNALKETYIKLVELRDEAAAADRIKSDFVENMSSEIRVPMGAIVEYSHLIIDVAEEDERPYIKEYGDIMSVNTDLLIRLVNDVLDLPQIESGDLSIHRSPSSVKGICNFALELVKKHVSPDVDIIFANEGQPDSFVLIDPQRVEQVLIQLLTNAAKFTEKGSITFGYEISPERDKISFTVTDTGIGIPRGMEEKVFERFVKVDPSTQGNGLGLYIGRLMANMLEGTLTLDPDYRSGARFIFTVPIV